MPAYRDAAYDGESVTLQNPHLRVDVHRRPTGWGWGELFTPVGQMIGVLDHLGEVKLSDQKIPLRLEAAECEREIGTFGERLTFHVKSMVINDLVKDVRVARLVRWPIEYPVMEGTVTLTLRPDAAILQLNYDLRCMAILSVDYVRGPWLKVGEGSFGAKKNDGIFPGVEWLVGDEWSSSTDQMAHPWALRVAPHPYQVAAPVMALSYGGIGIGLAWDPLARCMLYDRVRESPNHVWSPLGLDSAFQRYPQPVYASPNFVDRRNNHLMGLMIPSAAWGRQENAVVADPPWTIPAGGVVRLEAEVFVVQGTSLDVLTEWVRRKGLPEVPEPRYPLPEALDRIARAYNTHLWHENQGFGTGFLWAPSPTEPIFAERYITEGRDRTTATGLAEKVAWCRKQSDYRNAAWLRDNPSRFDNWEHAERLAYGRELLAVQKTDGSFPFDPDGRHRHGFSDDHHRFCNAIAKPLGLLGETALDLCMIPAMELLTLGKLTDEKPFLEGARRALDYCLVMERPEGGDHWETPLHSPNLLAAGHAAIAFYLGYQAFADHRYLEKAIYWIRSLLPFTHLWQPMEKPMVYDTKPCLTASDWYLTNWVQNHVQWEVLLIFAWSAEMGIDWAAIDPQIDWSHYRKGITVAALRWMIDREDAENTTFPRDSVESGVLDTCFADAHDAATGIYWGHPIEPDDIAVNLQAILAQESRDFNNLAE